MSFTFILKVHHIFYSFWGPWRSTDPRPKFFSLASLPVLHLLFQNSLLLCKVFKALQAMKIYFQNLVCCMMFNLVCLHDVFRKGWWTFKIKVRLICLIYFKETFTNEFYLYFESPPYFSKNIMQHTRFWK
jgi:hypothetical protein